MSLPKKSPRKRDAQATRLQLLTTAERVFVAKGFDGTRVDEVAHEAGVNKRMIYVYFGDKERLYIEILRANLQRVLDASRGAVDADGGPAEQASAAIRRYFQFCADNPSFVRLLSWESLNGGKRMGEVLASLASAGLQELHDVIQRGVNQGEFRKDTDVRKFVFSVHALCVSYFSRAELLEAMWGEDLSRADARDRLLDHILSLVLTGILMDPALSPKRRPTHSTGGNRNPGGTVP